MWLDALFEFSLKLLTLFVKDKVSGNINKYIFELEKKSYRATTIDSSIEIGKIVLIEEHKIINPSYNENDKDNITSRINGDRTMVLSIKQPCYSRRDVIEVKPNDDIIMGEREVSSFDKITNTTIAIRGLLNNQFIIYGTYYTSVNPNKYCKAIRDKITVIEKLHSNVYKILINTI